MRRVVYRRHVDCHHSMVTLPVVSWGRLARERHAVVPVYDQTLAPTRLRWRPSRRWRMAMGAVTAMWH